MREISTAPGETANHFTKSDLPFETSPAFFRPEVLQRYKSDTDRYTLEDRSISCRGAWHLQTITAPLHRLHELRSKVKGHASGAIRRAEPAGDLAAPARRAIAASRCLSAPRSGRCASARSDESFRGLRGTRDRLDTQQDDLRGISGAANPRENRVDLRHHIGLVRRELLKDAGWIELAVPEPMRILAARLPIKEVKAGGAV